MPVVPSVVVDCDPGVDDGVALLVLAHHHRLGRIRLAAVTAVAGNTPLDQAARNARFVLDSAGLADVPVLPGADAPVAGPSRLGDGSRHGDDGLGGCYRPDHGPLGEHCGARALAEAMSLAHAGGGDRQPTWLLAIGPLTNLAQALDMAPDLLRTVERVVAMGGALDHPGGGMTEHAEFNLWADPHAARRVLRAGLPLTLVPLDVTTRVLATEAEAATIVDRALAGRLVRAGIERYCGTGLDGWPMHDPLAAAVLLDPGLVVVERTAVDVDLEGEVAGRLRRADGPAIDVAVDVDAVAASDAICSTLAAEAGP